MDSLERVLDGWGVTDFYERLIKEKDMHIKIRTILFINFKYSNTQD